MAAVMGIKFRASSLVEVTVALVILVLAFGFSLMIYLNVTRSGQTLQKTRYSLLLKEYAENSKVGQQYVDEALEEEGYLLEREVTPYQGNPDLLLLTFTVSNRESKKVLVHQQEIVYVPRPD
jgi:Tfp pilus assembly protein PilV